MRNIFYLTLVSYCFLLISCVSDRDGIQATNLGEPTSLNEIDMFATHTTIPSKTLPTPTVTPSPEETLMPTLTFKSTIPSDTPTPHLVLRLCSPLSEQSINEIPEIVSDPYNPPGLGKEDRHHGTDIAYYRRRDRTTIEGELVQSLLSGLVIAVVGDQLPYGNMVIIETPRSTLPPEVNTKFEVAEGESLYTLYAHFNDLPLVKLGDWIDCGHTLGAVGASGYNIVNPHLHIETRVGPADQVFVDGLAYYDTSTTKTERSNYELWRTSGVFRHFDPMELMNTYLENSILE